MRGHDELTDNESEEVSSFAPTKQSSRAATGNVILRRQSVFTTPSPVAAAVSSPTTPTSPFVLGSPGSDPESPLAFSSTWLRMLSLVPYYVFITLLPIQETIYWGSYNNPSIMPIAWYTNGSLGSFLGLLTQALDKENHNAWDKGTKITAHLLSLGVYLSYFNDKSFDFINQLSYPADKVNPIFVLTGMIDFIVSIKDMVYHCSRTDFEYWLEDSLKELAHLNERIKNREDNQLMANGFTVQKNKEELLRKIKVRIRSHSAKIKANQQLADLISSHQLKYSTDAIQQEINKLCLVPDRRTEGNIKDELNKKSFEAKVTCGIKGITLLGMICFTYPHFIATKIIGVAATAAGIASFGWILIGVVGLCYINDLIISRCTGKKTADLLSSACTFFGCRRAQENEANSHSLSVTTHGLQDSPTSEGDDSPASHRLPPHGSSRTTSPGASSRTRLSTFTTA